MQHPSDLCQSCRRPATAATLAYRKGLRRVPHDSFLQCDICERFLCAECLEIHDIVSGDDFLCAACAAVLPKDARGVPDLRSPR